LASTYQHNSAFTIVGMKFSLIMMERICFQSVVLSPNSGLAIEWTSTRCCCFIDFTVNHSGQARSSRRKEDLYRLNSVLKCFNSSNFILKSKV
uniref:Uncharacterized protein n=1 Tax=Chrysemys picta bellii TaxID=8478 RepID=A0A8C3I594_CHRPI